jgi:hypothetical protein
MQYNQPYGVTDPNAGYINGDPSVGRPGSIPPAASIEYPQREIVALINAGNLTPNNSDLVQLAKAIQSGAICYGVDTSGVANTVVATLNPNPGTYKAGNVYFVKMKNAPTGPSTVNFNGIGFAPIIKSGGVPLAGGEWAIGDIVQLRCDGVNFQTGTVSGAGAVIPPNIVTRPTANIDIYVNASTGSDTLYDGTTAAVSGVHGPFKTIQKGVNTAFNYAPSQFQITIHVAAGTYNEAVATPSYSGPSLIIQGAGNATTMINGGANHTLGLGGPNVMTVNDISVTNSGAGGNYGGFVCGSNATMICNNTGSDVVTGGVFYASGGVISSNNHTYRGSSALLAVWSTYGGFITLNGTHTFANPININDFISAGAGATAGTPGAGQGNVVFVNPSYVTGKKFDANLNGVITALNLGVNFYPGTIAGTTESGGQYNG